MIKKWKLLMSGLIFSAMVCSSSHSVHGQDYYMNNGGYPPPNGGYPPPNGGYPPPNGGYLPANGGYGPPPECYQDNGYSGPEYCIDTGGCAYESACTSCCIAPAIALALAAIAAIVAVGVHNRSKSSHQHCD